MAPETLPLSTRGVVVVVVVVPTQVAIIPDFGLAVGRNSRAKEEEATALSVVSAVLRSRSQFHFVAMDLIGSS